MNSLILAFVLSLAGAQASSNADPERVHEIWNATNDRLGTQLDVWFDEGDFPKCIQLLKMQSSLFPGDYEVATNLGWMQENVENWDSALATYIRFKDRNPLDPDRSLPEADFYFRRKAYAKATAALEPALTKGSHPNAFRILAHAYERQGMLSDSKRVWEQYLVLSPKDGAARNNLNRVMKKLSATL